MFAIVGTVPDPDFPLVKGRARIKGDKIIVKGNAFDINRGTPALLAAAARAARVLGQPEPYVFLAGDTGLGHGSAKIYKHLVNCLGKSNFNAIVFHYLQPDVDWHNKVLFAVKEMQRAPALIADAGFMYAAKMSGQANAYDLFTPDAGELAFLADEEAPHPFYARGFILQDENNVPDLISRAYKHKNAARLVLVKGKTDYVADKKGVFATIEKPAHEAMEAIGGTGDTITGVVTALIASGMETAKAAIIAAKVNRIAASRANPTPATQVSEIIAHIPAAIKAALKTPGDEEISRPGVQ